MDRPLSPARKASYGVFALGLAVAAKCGLLPALIAGLFAYMLLSQTQRALRGAGAPPRAARWGSFALFLVLTGLLAWIFAAFARLGMARMPLLLDRALPRLDALAGRFGFELPFDDVAQLRELAQRAIRENARSITSVSGLLTRGFFQVLVAVIAAVLRFLAGPLRRPAELDAARGLDVELLHECGDRVALFVASFVRVMGAQVTISCVNTAATAVFLFGAGVPFRLMLTLATFVLGLLPIGGNIVSNTLIFSAALTVSDELALAALVFLVVIHKAEYFLNSRFVGARIDTPVWATLLGLLVGEAVLGVPGVILAPAAIYYVREELRGASSR